MIKFSHLIDRLDCDDLILYLGYGINMDALADKCAILFSHYLGRTGAPSMLLTMSKVLLSRGYQVFVFSPEDGEMREEFTAQGVNVIIYPDFLNNTAWLTTISAIFDFILVNTLACSPVIDALAPICPHIYWWIHEFESNFIGFYNGYKNVAITPSLRVLAASPQIQRNIKKYMHIDSEVLNFCVEDVPSASALQEHSVIHFLQIGTISRLKGQLVFLNAIRQLPPEIKSRCHFTFCGEFDSADPAILLQLYKASETDFSISVIPAMPREELLHYYDSIDVIVVSSYEESTSAIAVEGLMKGKVCICSDSCGVCDFLHDGKDAFFFVCGNSSMLSQKISHVVSHFTELDALKADARKVFEMHYSEGVFARRLTELCSLDSIPAHNPNLCSGCNACYEICPAKCIHIEQDSKGFSYPRIDAAACTSCGLCKKICPFNAPVPLNPIISAYGLKLNDEIKRKESQSGGAFTAFAEYILKNNGIVYGVGLTENMSASYMRVDSLSNLCLLKGSKYVQAHLIHIFPLVEKDLLNHKTVFFSGTACHIAGLYNYLKARRVNVQEALYTCDLVCHGVPSPKLFSDYMNYLKKTHGSISHFNFRDKSVCGWRAHTESFQIQDSEKYVDTLYASLFYSHYFLRESCYHCSYAHTERISDITISDFWGVEKQNDEGADNLGVSLTLLHTSKAAALFQNVQNSFYYFTANKDCYLQQNLLAPTPRPENTGTAWHEYLTFGFKYIAQTYGSYYDDATTSLRLLQIWENQLKHGESIAGCLKAKGIDSIILCGNKNINKLLCHEFHAFHLSISFILDIYNEEILPQIDNIPVKKASTLVPSDIPSSDYVLITDEVHFADIVEFLSLQKVLPSHMIPFSFLASEEM